MQFFCVKFIVSNVDNQRKLFKIQRQRHCLYIPEVVGILPNDAAELFLRYAAKMSKLYVAFLALKSLALFAYWFHLKNLKNAVFSGLILK